MLWVMILIKIQNFILGFKAAYTYNGKFTFSSVKCIDTYLYKITCIYEANFNGKRENSKK